MALALPQRSTYKPGADGDFQFQRAMERYNAEQAKNSVPVATPALAAPPVATPKPTATPPVTSTVTPAIQPGTTPAPATGLNQPALQKAGISQANIDQAQNVLTPLQQAQDAEKANVTAENTAIQGSLSDEQKKMEELSAETKKKKEELANEALAINDETAKVQEDRATQEYQQNKFLNEQAQKQFDLDAARAERKQDEANMENESQMRRAMAAQLGASFGSEGMGQIMLTRQRGEGILSDLRSQNAIGRAELSFKAMQVESDYTSSLKEISNDRRTHSFKILSDLDNDLTDIDEKVLMSDSQKRQAAREAITNYYGKLNDIDKQAAEQTSTAVDKLYEQKKTLDDEKLEKETFDPQMSSSLGYFANRYGQPIGIREGEQPKPFIGEYNENLSKQFGYLVDNRGQKIMGTDGKRIPYKDMSIQKTNNALLGLLSGNPSQADLSALNGKVGINSAISNILEDGKSYPSPKYGVLQCGEYINNYCLATPMIGSSFGDKIGLVDKYGGKRDEYAAGVGDTVVMDTKTDTGHVAIIEGISEDRQTYFFTDANYTGPGQVRHSWEVTVGDKNWNSIYGFARLPLKAEVQGAQPQLTPNQGGTDGTPSDQMSANSQNVNILRNIQENPSILFSIEPKERDALEAMAGGKDNFQKIVSGQKVEDVLGGGDNLGAGDIDTNLKLKTAVKPIADDLRQIELQASAFKDVAPSKRDPYTDQTLVYTFNKLLDPGSVVKESEYATVLRNSGWFQGFMGEISKADGKSILTDSIRKKLLDEMNRLYESKKQVYLQALKENQDFIKNNNIDPEKIFPFNNYLNGNKSSQSSSVTMNARDKIQQAKSANYPPKDIVTFLKKDPQYASTISKAEQYNYSAEEILTFLSK